MLTDVIERFGRTRVWSRMWRTGRRHVPAFLKRWLRSVVPRRWAPAGAFERECLAAMGVSPGQVLTSLQQLYVDFALSTNARGAGATDIIGRARPIRGSRCLDVGCAYGGFLVALQRRGARELVGIDIDERLLGLARVNLADHGVVARLQVADIHDAATVERLGVFDVIVCNDVLEHVLDVPTAIRHLCRLTAGGGLIYALIPNKNYPRYLLQDGHYQLQGLTLLSQRDAEAYHAAVTGGGIPYGPVSYRPLQCYVRHFRRHGLSVEVFNSGLGIYDLDQLRAEVERTRERFEGFGPPTVSAALASKMTRRFAILCRTFLTMMTRYDQARHTGDPAAEQIGDTILRRFGMEAWCLLARKDAERREGSWTPLERL